MSDKRNILVIYDIESTKDRNKVVHILESYGIRVQKSAFECYADDIKIQRMLARLKHWVRENDSIRIYYANSCFDVLENARVEMYSSSVIVV